MNGRDWTELNWLAWMPSRNCLVVTTKDSSGESERFFWSYCAGAFLGQFVLLFTKDMLEKS